MTTKSPICSTCKYWKSKQSELEYSDDYGICTCYKWKFGTTNYSDCMVLDRNNLTEKHMSVNRFESQSNTVPFGQVDRSQYCLVTEGTFGCIHHIKK